MKRLLLIGAMCFSCDFAGASDNVTNGAAWRRPFTLSLHLDKTHIYETEVSQLPYVNGDDVYLVAGDRFGIRTKVVDGKIIAIAYEPDTDKADIHFRFTQEPTDGGDYMMYLVVQSRHAKTVYVDALMVRPNKDDMRSTTMLPLTPRIPNCEGWPHPITQLVLRHFRFETKSQNNTSDGIRQPADGLPKPSR